MAGSSQMRPPEARSRELNSKSWVRTRRSSNSPILWKTSRRKKPNGTVSRNPARAPVRIPDPEAMGRERLDEVRLVSHAARLRDADAADILGPRLPRRLVAPREVVRWVLRVRVEPHDPLAAGLDD